MRQNPCLQASLKTFQSKIITHRGLCSIFVQNTIQAILAALYCSDLVQLDIQLTKDKKVIVFHDRGLKRVTDIQFHTEFSSRFKQANIEDDNKPAFDWWVRDFTLAELKTLNLRQDDPNRPQLHLINYKIPTLEEVLIACLKQKSKSLSEQTIKAGLLIQIKEEAHGCLQLNDILLCRQLSSLLNKFSLDNHQKQNTCEFPVYIQSFNVPLLSYVKTNNYIYHLYDEKVTITQELLHKNKGKNVIGIGITEENFFTNTDSIREICDKFGYQLNYWTIRDDRLNKIPFKLSSYNEVYLKLKHLGVNGFITEFPDKCRACLGIRQKINCDKTDILYKKTQVESKRQQFSNFKQILNLQGLLLLDQQF